MTLEIPRSHLFLKALIVVQFIIIVLSYAHARTPLVWIWSVFSFIPATIISFICDEKKYVLSSLILLFVSQHLIVLFTHQTWGYSFGGDSINDLHIASVISEEGYFVWGETGYSQRPGYSYYPMLHLFSVALSKLSGLSLAFVALYVIPIFNASFVAICLFYLNQEFFGLHSREKNLATVFFAVGWYYTLYSANFTREVFAFPFVLLTLLMFVRAIKQPKLEYTAVLFTLFAVVIISHQVSSYLILVVFVIITLGYRLSKQNGKTISQRARPLLLSYSVMLLAFTSVVTFDFAVRQGTRVFNAFQVLFQDVPSTVMQPQGSQRMELVAVYYLIIGVVSLVGGLRVLGKQRKRESTPLVLVLAFAFIICIMLRASVSAGPLHGWAYYLSLRGTIWAFIGISFLLIIGLRQVLKPRRSLNWKSCSAVLLIICILAAGKFLQNPLLISDPSIPPNVTYSRYKASLWLLAEAPHGSNLLVAPYSSGAYAFSASRSMAPYAYLSEYLLDKRAYGSFSGYIPLIGGYFDRYENSSNVNIIYSNGETQLGFKAR